jgi:hypothetical protein
MVKIPGLGDLKKMGGDLAQSATSGNLMNKISTMTKGAEKPGEKSDDPLQSLIDDCKSNIQDLLEVQKIQANLVSHLNDAVVQIETFYHEAQQGEAGEEESSAGEESP